MSPKKQLWRCMALQADRGAAVVIMPLQVVLALLLLSLRC
jgi:hypothetical protein